MNFQTELPMICPTTRGEPLLHSTPLASDEQVLALNLTQGCVHRCGFCTARASHTWPGDDAVEVIPQLPSLLERELKLRRPRAVFLSPSTDPFPPLDALQRLTADVISVLSRNNVESLLMTRGLIRTVALEVLAKVRNQVKITTAITTMDRSLQRRLEPLTAPPELRIRQIKRLKEMGIPVQVSLDPLLPEITDTTSNLQPLLEAIASVGVTQVSASYLYLRKGVEENLSYALRGTNQEERLLDQYQGGPLLTAPGAAAARFLPRARRQRGYARLMGLAATQGIKVNISALGNPDFMTQRTAQPPTTPRPRLRVLFAQQCETD